MPTYDFMCAQGHAHEIFCSISARPEISPCPECGAESRQAFLSAPHVWKGLYVLDYPGSKALKAGYVHSHVDPGVSKVSVGAGGALNPKSKPIHPIANNVIPDPPKRAAE
jgi:putative FmdB family regulatory protein